MINFFEFCRLLSESRASGYDPYDSLTTGSADVERKLLLRGGRFVDARSGKAFPPLPEGKMREVAGGLNDEYELYAVVTVEALYEYGYPSNDPQDGPHEEFSYQSFRVDAFVIYNNSDTTKGMELSGAELHSLIPSVFGIDPSLESERGERAVSGTVYVVDYFPKEGNIEVSVS